MSHLAPAPLLTALLDSWDRNHAIVTGLLRAIPPGALGARALPDSPTVGAMFSHLHYVRLVFVLEDAPECARPLPASEWTDERNPDVLARHLDTSAHAVRDAVRTRLETGRALDRHYDHPVLLLQHMIWHLGYHHGQIKLALKAVGQPLPDAVAGPVSWRIWMNKSGA